MLLLSLLYIFIYPAFFPAATCLQQILQAWWNTNPTARQARGAGCKTSAAFVRKTLSPGQGTTRGGTGDALLGSPKEPTPLQKLVDPLLTDTNLSSWMELPHSFHHTRPLAPSFSSLFTKE